MPGTSSVIKDIVCAARITIARMRWTLLNQAKRLDLMPGPLAFHDKLAPISAILAVLSGHWQPTFGRLRP